MNNNQKKKKVDRQSLYVTIIVIFMMVAVVVAVATSLAKNPGTIEEIPETTKKDSALSPSDKDTDKTDNKPVDTEDVFLDENDKDTEKGNDETKKPDSDTKDEDSAGSIGQSNTLPKFIAPVIGEILHPCSLETPVFSLTMEDYRTHTGVDLYCAVGNDVCSVAAGKIQKIWDDPMMGMCISVEHSGGAVSVYKNLCDDIPEGIKEGSTVTQGQVIATVGDTALMEIAEESHLHFELTINKKAVDPSKYIEFSSSPVFAD